VGPKLPVEKFLDSRDEDNRPKYNRKACETNLKQLDSRDLSQAERVVLPHRIGNVTFKYQIHMCFSCT